MFACAIDQAKHQETWFPFIACVEGKYGPDIEDGVESCADAAGLDYPDLRDCAIGAGHNSAIFLRLVWCQSLSKALCSTASGVELALDM